MKTGAENPNHPTLKIHAQNLPAKPETPTQEADLSVSAC